MRKNPMIKALAMVLTLVMVCTTVLAVPTSVDAAVKAKKITLSAKKQTVYIGKSVTLKVKKVTPAKASKAVKFTSSDSTVATVNGKGKVTGKKVGTATITVTSKSNAKAKATCKITVKQQVKKIQTAAEIIMQKGKSATIKYGITPADAANKKMTFATSNKKVATVDKKGKIKAKKPGKAKITVKSADGCAKATVKVTVKAKITPVKSVTLDQTTLSLNPGAAATLKATLTPAKPTSKKVYWVSSDTSVATVSTKGVVTAVADGTAKISVYASDNSGKSATCTVTVTTPAPPVPPTPEQPKPDVPTPPATVDVQSVSVDPTEVTLMIGQSAKAVATVAPANATNKTIAWSTSDAAVATVAADGKITAVAPGEANVIATSHNGKTATVKVTVEDEVFIPVESIEIAHEDIELEIGDVHNMGGHVTVLPENASNPTVSYSSDSDAVFIDRTFGEIVAVKEGTAVITVYAMDGSEVSATFNVVVKGKEVEPEEDEVIERGEITKITIKDDTDYKVSYTWKDKCEELNVNADQIAKAYDKYLEGLDRVKSVPQVWNKVTQSAADKLAEKFEAEFGKDVDVTITTDGNTKTVVATYGDYTAKVDSTLVGTDKIVLTVYSDKLAGGSKTVEIKNIELVDGSGSANVAAAGTTLDVTWSAVGFAVSKGDSTIVSVARVVGEYIAKIDTVIAEEVYQKALKEVNVTEIELPETFGEILDGLTIEKVNE